MTINPITLPSPVGDDENRTLNGLLAQLDAKRARNELRKTCYEYKYTVKRLSSVIPPQYYKIGAVLGWSAKAVDILARRCNLDGFVWPDGKIEDLGSREVWDSNALGAEISSALISSLIHSVSFLVTTEGDTGAGEPAVLIHAKDAMSATGEWNGRTRRLNSLLSVIDRDPDTSQPTALALYLDGKTITADRDGVAWSVDVQTHSWGVPAEALVYKPRVGRPFGMSRISRPVIALQNAALRTVARMEGHADVFGFPEFWMLGADESIFTDATGAQRNPWEVMLGRVKGIPDDEDAANPRAQVQQFAAASPQPHLEMLKQQAMLFSGETSIPLSSLGVSDMSNPTSADSYIASREDLIAEAEGATDDWAPPLRRTMARALAIANRESGIPAEWATIDTKWRSPLYLSRAAQADAGMKQLAAVPWLAETEIGLELLGLDDQQRRAALSEKRRLAGSGILDKLAAAAAQRAQPPQPVPGGPDAVAEQPLAE